MKDKYIPHCGIGKKLTIDDLKNYINTYEQHGYDGLIRIKHREKEILKMYYGIDCKSQTNIEIGIEFGVTSGRILQIKQSALRKIRWSIKEKGTKRRSK